MNLFEERLNDFANQWLKSNVFLRPVSWSLDRGIQVRSIAKDSLHSVLKVWGISAKTDLEKVYLRVDELEKALENSIEAEMSLLQRVEKLEAIIAHLQETDTPK